MGHRLRMDLRLVPMATTTMLRMRARPTDTTARNGLMADSSSAPVPGSVAGSMAAELDMDTVEAMVMATVVGGTHTGVADTAMLAAADTQAGLAGSLAAVSVAGTAVTLQLAAAADSVAAVEAVASTAVAVVASTAVVADIGKA